jgi:hypothetical protein
MAKFYKRLTPDLECFLSQQLVFFTATAPTEGRINLSPRGMDTLRCLNDRTVAWLDLTGSGNETAAHLRENRRMTIMCCSFSEQPLILRLYGRGRVVRRDTDDWERLRPRFSDLPGARQIMVLDIESIQTSCGFGVPIFGEGTERKTLKDWAQRKGETGLANYRREHNRVSIDGLDTGLDVEEPELRSS